MNPPKDKTQINKSMLLSLTSDWEGSNYYGMDRKLLKKDSIINYF